MKVELQRPQKPLWPGVTKADLALHLVRAAPQMLTHLRDRPLSLLRGPDGIASTFFQKSVDRMPDAVGRCRLPDGRVRNMVDDVDGLVALADQACLELHGWMSRCDAPERPDRMVIDLDPPDTERFSSVRRAAMTTCELLAARGATPFPLLTGSKGIHVVVPLVPEAGFGAVVRFTDALASVLARADPELTTAIRKAQREGRIFVDTLRNRPRQTAIVPWSPRALPDAPVALPVRVEDLKDPSLQPRRCTIHNAPRYLDDGAWDGFRESAVPLSALE